MANDWFRVLPLSVTCATAAGFVRSYRLAMAIQEFLPRASGYVRIHLKDGSTHTGHFRMDILSENALSAYFFGDVRDLSLPIELVDTIEALDELQLAS